ncbi:DNA sulfur modification protein DndB [Saccharibacillus deserti]|uniref:DNA sulfur modification protein DndB n=1 Tax=Saccharibacillus deserti TaxID=1634444 RepID=UPI00155206CE|nr:DNA sulfur modification protein DndB [Saccharibacillus deserti]
MLKQRVELEMHLNEPIKKIKRSRTKIHKVDNQFMDWGMDIGTFTDFVRKISELAGWELCLLTQAMYNVTNDSNIDPKEFFTEQEINSAIRSAKVKEDDNDEIKLPIVLSEVIKINYESFITKISMHYLAQMFESKLITYDYETQRSAKFRKTTDGVIAVPDVKISSVKNIAENMVNETYLEDMITLNVYSKEVEPIEYNEKSQELTINEGATISILDGFHRLQGGIRAYKQNPELNQQMILSIRSYDLDTAKRFFGQINTINPVKKERRKELLAERISDVTVANLQKKSSLGQGRIASASDISKAANQLTTFDLMSWGIDRIFKPTTRLEAIDLSEYLQTYFDYLVGSYKEEFLDNPNGYRDSYTNPLSFIIYLAIAKYFQSNDKKLSELKEYIENTFDFNDKELSSVINDARGINTKKVRNNVLDCAEKLIGGSGSVK